MIGMGVGDDGPFYRPPGVNMKSPFMAVKSTRREFQD
jgi:hypothetical protein